MGRRAGGRGVLVLLQLAVDAPQALQALQGSVATGGDAAAACGQPRQARKQADVDRRAGEAAHTCCTC